MGKLIIDGNSVYEIDEECMERQTRKNPRFPGQGREQNAGEQEVKRRPKGGDFKGGGGFV